MTVVTGNEVVNVVRTSEMGIELKLWGEFEVESNAKLIVDVEPELESLRLVDSGIAFVVVDKLSFEDD